MQTTDDVIQSQYLTCQIAGEEYGIGLPHTWEILEFQTLTKVPNTPPFVRGVINLRGRAVPVVDLAIKFGAEARPLTNRSCIIIVETGANGGRTVVGVLADAVNQVIELTPDQIEPPPSVRAGARGEHLHGLGRSGDRFILLLAPDRILAEIEPMALEFPALDTLREVANVAAAHAATSLSRLTDRTIMITVPDVLVLPVAEVPAAFRPHQDDLRCVVMDILGSVTGRILFLMPEGDARILADLLFGRAGLEEAPPAGLTESCLKETANILGGAYTSALAWMTGHDVMLSVPALAAEPLLELLSGAEGDQSPREGHAFCVTTTLKMPDVDPDLTGHLLFLAEPAALTEILRAVTLAAEQT